MTTRTNLGEAPGAPVAGPIGRALPPLALALGLVACRPAPIPPPSLEPGARAPGPVALTPVASATSPRAAPAAAPSLDPQAAALRRRALTAMDAGRLEAARALLVKALARTPDNLALMALSSAVERAIASRAEDIPPSDQIPPPQLLAPPPWRRKLVRSIPTHTLVPIPRLLRRSSSRNRITDDARWFKEHALTWPVGSPSSGGSFRGVALPPFPPWLPTKFRDTNLRWWIVQPNHVLALYEPGPGLMAPGQHQGRTPWWQVLVIFDAHGQALHSLEFSNYRLSPRTAAEDQGLAEQELVWAIYEDGVLYVSHGHWTYAKASGGQTGYITAIHAATGELYWRSDPKVSNARTFVLRGDYIISGYGFTKEPDSIFAIRAMDGMVMARTRVHSAPRYIMDRSPDLLIRSYDHDYVYHLEIPGNDDPKPARPPPRPSAP